MSVGAGFEAAGFESARFEEPLEWPAGYSASWLAISLAPALDIEVPASLSGWQQEHRRRRGT
jgi:hypothetical protein